MVSSQKKVPRKSQSVLEVMPHIFRPASVAVIGASRDNKKESAGGWVGRLINFGYKGKIYPINPQASEIMGLKAYPSVKDVPGPIDYTIINVPRHMVPQMLQEVVDKKVKAVHIYTAGFAEAGDEEGKILQKEIEGIISGSQTRLIGPNCVGVYSPAGGLTFSLDVAKEAGEVSFITQTGTGGRRLVYLANTRGLRFSKVVSFGNAVDLSGEDFLEYFISDPDTKVILMYIEGLKSGQRFFKLVREAVKVKPVIILAAGLTEGGAGAAASHTAALAGSERVWQAFFKQTGAMQVESFEEAIDQLVAALKMPPIKGTRVGLIGRGGGLGVVTTDMCERAGLKVPQFTPEVRAKLTEITPATAGSSVRNPVEIGIGRTGISEHYAPGIILVASDPQVDFIIAFHNPEMYVFEFKVKDWVDGLSKETIAVAKTLSKPLAVAFLPGSDPDVFKDIQEAQRQLLNGGIACFPTIEAAVRATSKLARYYQILGS
ncbi:CoA-binding protein [Chloroflexota bacterium]